MKKVSHPGFALLAGFVILLAPAAAMGQDSGWSGELGLSAVGLNSSGSEASFLTQTNLSDGFNLDSLRLDYATDGDRQGLEIEAWGFGNATPAEHARILYRTSSPLTISLDYDKRSSFFSLDETPLGLRNDEWDITAWKGRVSWDGWSAARLILDLRHVAREGTANRPFFGLNDIFPLRVDFDESMSEAAVRLETNTLPVKLTLEQAWTVYTRENLYSPGDGNFNNNPNELADVTTTRSDEITVPTTHVTAAWAGERVDFAAAALYSPAELDTTGFTSSTFAIGGGEIGRLEFIDDLLGSANRDTSAADVRFGVLFGRGFSLRLSGDYRDTKTDGAVLGERIVRATNPDGGVFDFTGSIGGDSVFDTTDSGIEASLEWTNGDWSLWAGGFQASREVNWSIADDESYDVTRDSDGLLVGFAWRGNRISLDGDYRRGTFERYVFRTDPDTVDRFNLKLRAEIGNGWMVHASGFAETSDNAPEITNLDHKSNGLAGGVSWSSSDGDHGFGLDLDKLDLTTETGLVLPTGDPGESIYDLSLLTTSLWGRTSFGVANLYASLTRVDDSGETWPIDSLIGKARVAFPLPARMEVAVFGEYWSYEEERGGLDDFDVTRYGVTLTWRFD